MPTINAGASTAVTVAVGTYLEGTGAGMAVIGPAAVVEPLTAGDAWQVGPFDRATLVSITAGSPITYTVRDNMRDPSEADKLPLASVAAMQALVSEDGTSGASAADQLLRATDSGAILLPRAHPNYHCHFFAGDYFADNNKISDRSGNENHAVLMSALTGAVAGANAGYISTAAALNQMWEIPDPNFDLGAGESVLFHWHVNMPRAATSTAIYGNGSGSSAGLRLTVDAGVQDNLSIAIYNSAGATHTGGSSIPNGNTVALDGVLKSISIYVDASNPADKRLHAWVNGVIARNNTAITLAGSTASNSRPRVGGTQSSTTGTVITKTRALAIFKWAAGETVPTQAQVTTAINRLIALPGQLLMDGDL